MSSKNQTIKISHEKLVEMMFDMAQHGATRDQLDKVKGEIMEELEKTKKPSAFTAAILGIVSTVLIGLGGWTIHNTSSNQTKLATLEANQNSIIKSLQDQSKSLSKQNDKLDKILMKD